MRDVTWLDFSRNIYGKKHGVYMCLPRQSLFPVDFLLHEFWEGCRHGTCKGRQRFSYTVFVGQSPVFEQHIDWASLKMGYTSNPQNLKLHLHYSNLYFRIVIFDILMYFRYIGAKHKFLDNPLSGQIINNLDSKVGRSTTVI